jgi:ATP-dependent Lon protease
MNEANTGSSVDRSLQVEIEKLRGKVEGTYLPEELRQKVFNMIDRLTRLAKYGGYPTEYENLARYIDWVTSLPWRRRTVDRLDLQHVKEVLDEHHYGLGAIKERLLEYLAILELHRRKAEPAPTGGDLSEGGKQEIDISEAERVSEVVSRAPILLFVGLVGTGKTTLAYAIADAMNRKFTRIPFGGMGDADQLRGQSRSRPDAEPGQVMKALRRAGSKNPVLLLDEIDRVAEGARSDIMGVLIELLDPEQNTAFIDHYIDFPFDLSEVLFVATCNNTTNISPAVLDRLEPIQMPSYTDEQKITIGKDYILPAVMKETGLGKDTLMIDEAVWPMVVRPLGYDAGIRTLERTIRGICRKVAKMLVEGKGEKFFITKENVKEFIPDW